MTYAPARKGGLYRITGMLIIENNGAFIYPSDVFTNHDYDNRLRLDNAPFFILDVDCLIDDTIKAHEYIMGVVQGYNGTCYLSSYNTAWLRPF